MPVTNYQYSFQNEQRDLSDVLHTINQGQIGFISLFKTGPKASAHKVEWLEDERGYRSINVKSNSDGAVTIDSSSAPVVGMVIQPIGKPDVFYVASVTSSTAITIELAGNNGGTLTKGTAPTGKYRIISAPVVKGSTHGEENFHQSSVNFNYTQIWRKEAALARSDIQSAVYGLENTIQYQVARQLEIISKELNSAAISGVRVQRTDATYNGRGQAGGLYYFATGENALSIDAEGATADDFLINDGSQAMQEKGVTANVILTTPGQARVIGSSMKEKIIIEREDRVRGTFVGTVVNSMTGTPMRIIADDGVVDGDIWVLDDSAFELRWMQPIYDWDPQDGEFDGVRRCILGEGTFQFNNILARACRITNCKDAATALQELRSK